jgi:hypothetical protein
VASSRRPNLQNLFVDQPPPQREQEGAQEGVQVPVPALLSQMPLIAPPAPLLCIPQPSPTVQEGGQREGRGSSSSVAAVVAVAVRQMDKR